MSPRQQLAEQVRKIILDTTERLPVTVTPPDGTWSCVDDGDALGNCTRRVQARFRDGQWKRPNGTDLPWTPTHWVRFKSAEERKDG